MTDDSERNYAVGRGKPPVATQFKPGKSGNPQGARLHKRKRDRGTIRDLAMACANEQVTVTVRGRQMKISKKEAVILAVTNDALTSTAAHRLKAMRLLADIGAYDVPAEARADDPEARRIFFQRLVDEVQRDDHAFRPA